MRVIFLLVFIFIRATFCGYTTKVINESKGYSGGFLMGILLAELGILIAAFKKEQPNAQPNSYRVVPVLNVLKKYHYPFVSPQVEPIDILKGNIYAEGEAAKLNLVFLLIHGFFMLGWYSVILGAYIWYLIGYTIYWLFKYKLLKKETPEDFVSSEEKSKSGINTVRDSFSSLKDRAGNAVSNLSQKTEGVKTDAAEKAAFAKKKAGAAFTGLKDKATAFAAERKKSDNSNSPVNDAVEDTNDNFEEIYAEADAGTYTTDSVEEASESESFDALYEKAMNTANDEERYHEEAASEADAENDYSEKTIGDAKSPVLAPSVDPSSTPHTSQQPKPAPRQFSYEEEKKSPVVLVLVGVIAILLVGMGILGGMLLMKNKDNKGSDDLGNNAVVPTTSDSENEISTSTIVDKNNESQTEISTEEISTEPITENADDQYTSEEVSAMYSAYLSENPDPNHTYDDPKYGYFLIDLNEDGTQELVITSDYIEDGSPDIEAVYAITQNRLEAVWLSDVRTYNFLCEGNIIQAEYIYPTGLGTVFYKYSSINELVAVENITYDGTYYSVTNNANYVITEEEANSILNQYKKMKFEAKPLKIAAAATTTSSTISSTKIESAKDKAVTDLRNELKTTFSINGMNVPLFNVTIDYDINGDYIPELIISYMGIADTNYHIYYYDGSQFVELKKGWGGLEISEDAHLIFEKQHGGGVCYNYYELSKDYELNKIDEIGSYPVQNGYEYYRNGQSINHSEYSAALNYYSNMNWVDIEYDASNIADSGGAGISGNDTQQSDISSKHTVYDTSAAGSDFSFNNEPYSRKVRTESTGLNLRAAPLTSAEIIIEMPKDSNVSLWGVNSEWAYVSYTVNGTTYYGYASRQYIGLP